MSKAVQPVPCNDYQRDPEKVGICARCGWVWDQHPVKPAPPPLDLSGLTVSDYIQRLERVTVEDTVPGPLEILSRTQVIAQLYQAKALERIADALEKIVAGATLNTNDVGRERVYKEHLGEKLRP
jgi:hypothetical protein